MKLPWDKNYIKICFHIVLTLVATYLVITLIDGVAFVIADIFLIIGHIFSGIGWILALFSPLILSFVIAYLLDPIVEFYQDLYDKFHYNVAIPWLHNNNIFIKKRKKQGKEFRTRFMGATLTYLTIIIGLSLLIYIVAIQFEAEGIALMINETVETVNLVVDNITDSLDQWEFFEPLSDYIDALTEFALVLLTESIPDILTAVATTGAWVLDLIISIVVAFYFLNHKDRIRYQLINIMNIISPQKVNRIFILFLSDLHFVFSGYIRGMMLDGIILGTMIGIALAIIGAQLAIPIGILTVIFNMIPFFGGIMAFIIAVLSELILGDTRTAFLSAIAIVVIQQIDSIFIIPKVVGENVKLSAPIVMLSLTIAATISGLMGMLLIVPTIAILKIFVMRFLERYTAYKIRKK